MRHASLFFAALADPTRLRLLHLMRDGEICVCFLQEILQTNQPKISRHLAYLKRAGLVEARRDGKWMHYRLKPVEKECKPILDQTLKWLRKQPSVQRDLSRLAGLDCSPKTQRSVRPRKQNSRHAPRRR
ncbi:MAG: Arsenical resistance operon repressor [Pedosphaera sp.]|nr:Arsenical resistance operon repressor [Pedosphaera sp.]